MRNIQNIFILLRQRNCIKLFFLNFSNPAQCMAVSEGIFKILLLDLKLKSAQLKRSEDYHCPFNMKTPQHPVITILLQSKHLDIIDIGNRICAILNHRDKLYVLNSSKSFCYL